MNSNKKQGFASSPNILSKFTKHIDASRERNF